jgi:hypothetical protein
MAIETVGAVNFFGGTAAARDNRQGRFVLDLLTGLLVALGLFRADGRRRPQRVQPFFDDLASGDVAAGDSEVQRTAFIVDNVMDLFGAPGGALAGRTLSARSCAITR